MGNKRTKSISLEGFVFLAIFFWKKRWYGYENGRCQYLNTLMNGYICRLETVFYIMAIAVLPWHFQDCSQNSVSFRW